MMAFKNSDVVVGDGLEVSSFDEEHVVNSGMIHVMASCGESVAEYVPHVQLTLLPEISDANKVIECLYHIGRV